jgi:hypothetical protein
LRAIIGQNTLSYADARISQLDNALAGVTWIHVNRANNHVSDSSLENRVCARSSASFCGARFQRNIKRGPGGHPRGEIAEAFNFSVLATRFPMMSLCDDSIVNDQNCANRGIRAGLTERLPRLAERRAHKLFVSSSIHRFETSIVVLARRGNAGFSAHPWHSARYQNINAH